MQQSQENQAMRESLQFVLDSLRNDYGPDTPDRKMENKLISCDAETKTAIFEYPVQEWELNLTRMMHGGIMMALFDNAMGILANHFSQTFLPTSSLSINFITAVPEGDTLIITSKVTSQGKRLFTATAEGVLKSSGKIAATAIGTFAVTGLPKRTQKTK